MLRYYREPLISSRDNLIQVFRVKQPVEEYIYIRRRINSDGDIELDFACLLSPERYAKMLWDCKRILAEAELRKRNAIRHQAGTVAQRKQPVGSKKG